MRSIDLGLSSAEVFWQVLPLCVATIWALESKTLVNGRPLLAVLRLPITCNSTLSTDELDLLTLPPIVICTSVPSWCIGSVWSGKRLALLASGTFVVCRCWWLFSYTGAILRACLHCSCTMTVGRKILVELVLKSLGPAPSCCLDTLSACRSIWIWNDDLSFLVANDS